ncbi:MAG: magnesium protoporphyrin IX methyltransferase [Pseudomonadota bacterium]
MSYARTLARVETYFDQTATQTWERLTSDAPVSRIRATVRAGRAQMRDLLLSRLPPDLSGQRILDAGCGAGQMTAELAARGADVVAVDISPSLVEIAKDRLASNLRGRVEFVAGDMLNPTLGSFDHCIAMDSLIYYSADDIAAALSDLSHRVASQTLFTVAPKTPALMAMWYAGKFFPRSDRSPVMVPHVASGLSKAAQASGLTGIARLGRVASGFYISDAMEVRR